jgi:mono/diheme cytochrome c family protein
MANAAQAPKKSGPEITGPRSESSLERDANGIPVGDDPNGLLANADVERGKRVFQKIGLCISCHGWDGDGSGKNSRSEGAAAMLRETGLDAETLISVVRCGLPGTPMPYHDAQAYKKPELCNDQVMADFDEASAPRKGHTFKEADIINVVAYIETKLKGYGKATLADCEEAFQPGAGFCVGLK